MQLSPKVRARSFKRSSRRLRRSCRRRSALCVILAQEARLRLQEMEAREKVKDCDASADAMEVLRAEAQRLAELQEQRRGEAELRRERLDAELLAARTALRREARLRARLR